MTFKKSYVDSQRLATKFKIGDSVLFPIFTRGNQYAPVVGLVTAVLPRIGFLDVETPFGNVRIAPEDVVRTESHDASHLEDTSYSTWDRDQAKKVASRHLTARLTAVASKASEMRTKGYKQDDTEKELQESNKESYSISEINEGVKLAYTNETFLSKTAIYWRAKGRRYMPSQKEVMCGEFSCPNCRNCLERTQYKKHTKLYVCRECLFTIRPADLLSPGQIVEDCQELQEGLEDSPLDFFSANDPLLKHFTS